MIYFQAFLGILTFIAIAILLSENKKSIPIKLIISSLLLQLFLALFLLKIPFIQNGLFMLTKVFQVLDQATKDGTSFVFGYIGGGKTPFISEDPASNFIIAFQILPIIIVVSAISSLLFHIGVLQKIINFFSLIFKKIMKVDGVTATGVASSIFLGIIESPLFIKPYLKEMNRSSLFTLLTAGMATVAGSVMVLYSNILANVIENAGGQILVASIMSAPAAIMMAQIMIPQQKSIESNEISLPKTTKSSFEAIVNGTSEGTSMVIGITGILIVLFAFISLINSALSFIPTNSTLTIQSLVSYLFVPFCWLMGIESSEVLQASELMGIKLILNEFVAYTKMGQLLEIPRHKIIMTYAMCGFANFGSLGILVGGLGVILPSRKQEVLELSLKAIIAGTLSTMMTGALISFFV